MTRHFLDEKCLSAVKIVQTVNEMVKGESVSVPAPVFSAPKRYKEVVLC